MLSTAGPLHLFVALLVLTQGTDGIQHAGSLRNEKPSKAQLYAAPTPGPSPAPTPDDIDSANEYAAANCKESYSIQPYKGKKAVALFRSLPGVSTFDGAPYVSDNQELQLKVGKTDQGDKYWVVEPTGSNPMTQFTRFVAMVQPDKATGCPDEAEGNAKGFASVVGSSCTKAITVGEFGTWEPDGFVEGMGAAPKFKLFVGAVQQRFFPDTVNKDLTLEYDGEYSRWMVKEDEDVKAVSDKGVACLKDFVKFKLPDGQEAAYGESDKYIVRTSTNQHQRYLRTFGEQFIRGGFWAEEMKAAFETLLDGILGLHCVEQGFDAVYIPADNAAAISQLTFGSAQILFLLAALNIPNADKQEEQLTKWNVLVGWLESMISLATNSVFASKIKDHQLRKVAESANLTSNVTFATAAVPMAAKGNKEVIGDQKEEAEQSEEELTKKMQAEFLQLSNTTLPERSARHVARFIKRTARTLPGVTSLDARQCAQLTASFGLSTDIVNVLATSAKIIQGADWLPTWGRPEIVEGPQASGWSHTLKRPVRPSP